MFLSDLNAALIESPEIPRDTRDTIENCPEPNLPVDTNSESSTDESLLETELEESLANSDHESNVDTPRIDKEPEDVSDYSKQDQEENSTTSEENYIDSVRSSSLTEDESVCSGSTDEANQSSIHDLTQTDNITTKTSIADGKGIRCMYTNADSLLGKRDLLRLRIEAFQPDIVAITELLPKNRTNNTINTEVEFQLEGFQNFYGANNKRGVMICVSNHIKAQKLEELTNNKHEEQVWCILKIQNGPDLLIGCMYHSPNSTQENFDTMLNHINEVCKDHNRAHIVIMGDFNRPDIDWVNYNGKSDRDIKFIETLQDNFLTQFLDQPTRHRQGQKPNIDDLLISNHEDIIQEIMYMDHLGKSDHLVIGFNIQCRPDCTNKRYTKYKIKRGDFQKMDKIMAEQNWDRLAHDLTLEQLWDTWQDTYDRATEECIPKAKMTPQKWKRPLWMNKNALQRVRKKYWAWKRYSTTGQYKDYERYIKERNTSQKECTKLRKNFEQLIAREAKTNPKAFWSYIKNQTKAKSGISPITKADGEMTNSDYEKAEVLNSFFASVFTQEDITNIPTLDARNYKDTIQTLTITENDVRKQLKKLKGNKSSGPDNIHPFVLKQIQAGIINPLTKIFQKSISEGRIPPQWKLANVTAIFKKGNKNCAGNYRPVSLTSVICKMLESIIRDKIMDHLAENNLLSDNQYGFRSHRSTQLQLLKTLDDWTSYMDSGSPWDVIYLDFRKAFDTVPHRRLLNKLSAYGIKGPVLNWIKDFLLNRKQKVTINGCTSKWENVTSGIPQGSVLGPVLFIIYINDLPDVIQNLSKIFADDTKMYSKINNRTDSTKLQDDLDNLIIWSEKWQMAFNVDKCKVIHYGQNNPQNPYTMMKDGERTKLTEDTEEKDLGVLFDRGLKFSNHIAACVNKANRMVGLIRRSFKYMDNKVFIQLYKALIRPHLEYANVVWNPMLIGDLEHLEKVQRRATKMVPAIKDRTYEDRLQILELPTLVYRRKRGDMIQVYKILHNLEDIEPSSLLQQSGKTSTRGHSMKLLKQHCRTKTRQNFFSQRVVNDWNSLTEEVVQAPSINAFKNRLDKLWNNIPCKFNYKPQ